MTSLASAGIRRSQVLLSAMVGLLLTFLMVITFVDVIGRKLGYPLAYTYELTQISLGLIFYIGLPLVTAQRGHVVIDMLVMHFSHRVRRLLQVFMDGVCFLLGLVWCWQLWLQAGKLAASNNVFMFTQLPIAPVVYVMSVMTFFTACVYLNLLVSGLQSKKDAAG
jgi:TRAP-type C4-dicarboxylate transport system permease small subunit